SGSGKTTRARILSGHLAPDAGAVTLEGAPLTRSWRRSRRTARRRIQLVMQDPWNALSPRLTVAELVREPLDVAAAGCGAADETAGRMLDAVGLPASRGFLTARAHELSGGQLQRVALARALAAGPKLLVADEPTSMLDASEQARLLVVLRELQVEMGLGLVLVSHDMAVVRKVTDRVVALEDGCLVDGEEPGSRWLSA
ncbi:MAG: ATP-binding cassette domain-containing protein, partial [Solirubrobacterales bacterium]|nr:ATP-binding cassette domain-containing protein [Solirubrobacterales bacterium]